MARDLQLYMTTLLFRVLSYTCSPHFLLSVYRIGEHK